MSYINKYLRNFKPYKVASHKIWQVSEEERRNILKLDWNEATISPSPRVKERLTKLMEEGVLNYYPPTYNNELHRLLGEYVQLPLENIQYFASSDSLHEYIAKLYITVGDPALLAWPSYDNFRLTAEVAGANVMYYELEDSFRFVSTCFEQQIENKRPSLVYICNPNNPIGYILKKDYVEFLLKRFSNTVFVIDEAYIEFAAEYTCKDLVLKYNNILITRTMSKAFGLANIRFGYLLSSKENIDYISRIRNPKNITSFAQEAVIGALSDVKYMREYVAEVTKAKEYFVKAINETKYFKAYDSYANFVLIKCENNEIKYNMINYLEDNNIFIRDTNHSDTLKSCVRVTIGRQEQMKNVVKIIRNFEESI